MEKMTVPIRQIFETADLDPNTGEKQRFIVIRETTLDGEWGHDTLEDKDLRFLRNILQAKFPAAQGGGG